jgi:Leucine-rich repeat (LRR) protein
MKIWQMDRTPKTLKKLWIVALVLSAANLASSLNSSEANENNNIPPVIRTINFPKNYSLGILYIVPFKPDDLTAYPQHAIRRQKAQGQVQVRDKGLTLLTGSYQLAENMSALKNLMANDLQVLDMYRTDITDKDITNISGLSGLVGIQLDDTEIGDDSINTICRLPNLKFISLSSTQITGATIGKLAALKHLRRIELGHNVLKKEYLSELLKIRRIERLGLQGCKIDDKDLDVVGKLDNLTSLLLLENTQITDLGLKKLAGLKKLSVLEIPHAQITPNGLKALVSLPIKRLIIGKKQFTPPQIERIKQMFPQAEITVYDNSNRMDPELFRPLH